MANPVFEKGEKVRALCNYAYNITKGKTYEVVMYEPEFCDGRNSAWFTWPAYLTVIGDDGKAVGCHAHRFAKLNADQLNADQLKENNHG